MRMHCALPNVFSIELAHTSKSIAEQALSQEHARAHTHTHTHRQTDRGKEKTPADVCVCKCE